MYDPQFLDDENRIKQNVRAPRKLDGQLYVEESKPWEWWLAGGVCGVVLLFAMWWFA